MPFDIKTFRRKYFRKLVVISKKHSFSSLYSRYNVHSVLEINVYVYNHFYYLFKIIQEFGLVKSSGWIRHICSVKHIIRHYDVIMSYIENSYSYDKVKYPKSNFPFTREDLNLSRVQSLLMGRPLTRENTWLWNTDCRFVKLCNCVTKHNDGK